MLPKNNRLKKKSDFERVFKEGKVFKNKFLIIRVAKNELKETRFGFVVSQKVSKKAVIRNKVRRRLSETVGGELKELKKGLDIVFVSLSGIEKKEFSEIKEEIKKLLIKSKILNV